MHWLFFCSEPNENAVELMEEIGFRPSGPSIFNEVWVSVTRKRLKSTFSLSLDNESYHYSQIFDKKMGTVFVCFKKNDGIKWEKHIPANIAEEKFTRFIQGRLDDFVNIEGTIITKLAVFHEYPLDNISFRSFLLKVLKSELLQINTFQFTTVETVMDQDLSNFINVFFLSTLLI